MKASILLVCLLALGGCESRGLMSGAVDGDNMVRARVIEGDLNAQGPSISAPFTGGNAGTTEGRVETTSEPVNVSVDISITTPKATVRARN